MNSIPYSKHQTSFVDTTESGIIDQHSLRQQKQRFYGLSVNNQTIIKNRFCFKYDSSHFEFERMMAEQLHFTYEQFTDFKDAIDYYISREKYPHE